MKCKVKKYLIYFSLPFLLACFPASGSSRQESVMPFALVIQSVDIRPYNRVYQGIRKAYGKNIERVILYGYKGNIREIIQKKRPSIIFTIGEWALSRVIYIHKIPIVYAMILNPYPFIAENKNITGVSMLASPDRTFKWIKKYLPTKRRIGIVYDPNCSRFIYRIFSPAAKKNHLFLITKRINSTKEVISAIKELSEKIDIFLMFPDTTIITPETISFMNLFFLKKSIPVVTFSEKYLNMGAFMAVYTDPYEIGIKAGNLAKQIIQRRIKPPPIIFPKGKIKINPYVAKNFGLDLKSAINKNRTVRLIGCYETLR